MGTGAPDINWCIDGREWWIELKVERHKGDKPLISLLRPTQIAWHIRRVQAGGKVMLVVYYENTEEYRLFKCVFIDNKLMFFDPLYDDTHSGDKFGLINSTSILREALEYVACMEE